jgi:HlyD family secretion protein
MKRKPLIITISIAVVVVALIVYSAVSGKEKEIRLETEVARGPFEIAVMVTGELQALNVTDIEGPAALRSRNLRIRNVLIQDMITEGTVVDSGDWVATLDRSEADYMLKDMMDEMEQEESEFMPWNSQNLSPLPQYVRRKLAWRRPNGLLSRRRRIMI